MTINKCINIAMNEFQKSSIQREKLIHARVCALLSSIVNVINSISVSMASRTYKASDLHANYSRAHAIRKWCGELWRFCQCWHHVGFRYHCRIVSLQQDCETWHLCKSLRPITFGKLRTIVVHVVDNNRRTACVWQNHFAFDPPLQTLYLWCFVTLHDDWIRYDWIRQIHIARIWEM